MPHSKRHPLIPAAIVFGAILLVVLAYRLAGEIIFAPRFASQEPIQVVRAYFTAQQWGYRGLTERALAPDLRERIHAPNAVRPIVDDAFLAGDLTISEPQETPLYGEYDEELLFVVTYRSRWRQATGEPPGSRMWFVYAGRDPGESWQILSQGTGP